MNLSLPAFILVFLGVFTAMTVAAGLSVGGTTLPDTSGTVAAITGPFPTISNTAGTCSFSAAGPVGTCTIIDTLGLGGVWALSSIGSILYRIGATLFLFVQLIQIMGSLTTIPFVGPIFAVFVVILALYGYSHLRGNHPNL